MTVRPAQTGDIPAIGRLLEEVELVHHRGRPDLFKNGGRKYNDAELEIILSDGSRPVFVCDDEAEGVLGYAFCVLQDHAGESVMEPILTLYVDDICVFERFRGRGVGRALYEHVRRFAKSLGCHNVTLNVWECNPGAKAFYEKMGLAPYKYCMEDVL